jgi:hypothetical protein
MPTETKGRGRKRPSAAVMLVILVLLLGIGALVSGPMLFLEPSGRLMQWNVDQLKGTPFPDYTIPGMVLFLFLGVFPLFVSLGLAFKFGWKWPDAINPSKRHHWAWAASWAAGIIVLLWIAVETLFLGIISFLQPVIGVWGALILILTLLPGVSRYYLR